MDTAINKTKTKSRQAEGYKGAGDNNMLPFFKQKGRPIVGALYCARRDLFFLCGMRLQEADTIMVVSESHKLSSHNIWGLKNVSVLSGEKVWELGPMSLCDWCCWFGRVDL